MRPLLFVFLTVLLSIYSCSSSQHLNDQKIQQGLEGTVQIVKGNNMPSPDLPPTKPKPYPTTVYIHALTSVAQLTVLNKSGLNSAVLTPLIATVETDSTGHFRLELPPGQYSVFVKYKNGFYANWFNEKNQIGPSVVEEKKITQLNLLISAEASF